MPNSGDISISSCGTSVIHAVFNMIHVYFSMTSPETQPSITQIKLFLIISSGSSSTKARKISSISEIPSQMF